MTEAPRPEHDGIHYHIEELPGDRGSSWPMWSNTAACSYRFGSPAPLDRVRAAAAQPNRFPNPGPEKGRL